IVDILLSMRKYMSRSKQIIYLCNLTMSVQVTKFLCEKHLVASSTPPSDPPIPSPTPSTSTSDPSNPIILPTTDIPTCPIQFSREELTQIGGYTDRQFFILAKTLQDKPNRKKGPLKTFLSAHPTDVLAASIKQLLLSRLTPTQQ